MNTPPSPANMIAYQASVDAEKLDKTRIAEMLVAGALYARSAPIEGASRLPDTLQLHCAICDKEQTFERTDSGSNATDKGWGRIATYRCRNCKRQNQKYMYAWTDQGFSKTGQSPELLEAVDPQLKKVLDKSYLLYLKAIRSRNFGFGIGALAYLRRIVEDETDLLMGLLKDDRWESWGEDERKQFEKARSTFQYSQKIEYAAESILPSAAFANGRDSFTALHDVTSSGLHGKTEEECIKIFDRCNLIFTRTFRMLSEHKRERDEFAAQLLALKR
jgi:hypothetical protein